MADTAALSDLSGCSLEMCSECRGPWHRGMSCDQFQRKQKDAQTDAAFEAYGHAQGWKPCPRCGRWYQKVVGMPYLQPPISDITDQVL